METLRREIPLYWLARALRAVVRRLPNVSVLCSTSADHNTTLFSSLVRALLHNKLRVASIDDLASLPSVALEAPVVLVCVETDDVTSGTWPPLSLDTACILVGFSVTSSGGLMLQIRTNGSSNMPIADLETAVQPLHELKEQCGLPLALELLSSLESEPRALPFQLLLMVLRWSCFHPLVLRLVATTFVRKLTLVPQPRVRHEIETLYASYACVWREIHGPDAVPGLTTLKPSTTGGAKILPVDMETETTDLDGIPSLERLSQCALWDKQKQFYRDQGIKAWSNHLIPFGVSSSSYLAKQYARLAIDFFKATAIDHSSSSSSPRTPNCFVWEAASGSCKFLHAFLLHFYALVDHEQLETRWRLVPCVIATDLSDQVLASRATMACFQPYLATGRLEFALFDTDTFLHGPSDERNVLWLRQSERPWRVGRDQGPVFIIGNYFFDSLRSDVFVMAEHEDANAERHVEVREARIDPTTDNIPDMLFTLTKLPRDVSFYTNSTLNKTFVATLDRLETLWRSLTTKNPSDSKHSVLHSSLILFPVEAIAFLEAVLHIPCEESSFPVAIVTGDATFSFRDAVPSTFIDETTGDLEIPQLSPHPDCFCLPVDLEILELAVASIHPNTSASIVATPASDTFNLFFAQSHHIDKSHRVALTHRFHDVFDQFTPCDCDLLWGMMSVDDGTKHMSSTAQVALLAQSAWDFDVFSVVQWSLLFNWNKQMQDLAEGTGGDPTLMENERCRLVEAGRQSLRTWYVLDDHESITTTAWTKLQDARWFYALNAWDDAKTILQTLECDDRVLQVASTYLLGLVAYHQNELWTALSYFRKGQRLEPNRLRLKKWVARTLLGLQQAKLHDEKRQ